MFILHLATVVLVATALLEVTCTVIED